tara:strand:- start:218 stop:493 length:276 start_codon:yes stop_codon:yes gene_type:complete
VNVNELARSEADTELDNPDVRTPITRMDREELRAELRQEHRWTRDDLGARITKLEEQRDRDLSRIGGAFCVLVGLIVGALGGIVVTVLERT